MNRLEEKRNRHQRRVKRVRFAIVSRSIRPRLLFCRTNRYIFTQLIDDLTGKTICSANTKKDTAQNVGKNKDAAAKLGEIMAKKIQEKNIKKVVLDRRGRLYHGKVKAFADAARENGLEF